jgi:DNA-binding transcriptional regulator GbsR (MarR family)
MAKYSDGFLVRDKNKKTRFYIDNEFLEKGYVNLLGRKCLVYFALARHANAESQSCFPSYEIIMKETGIHNRNVVAKTINALEYLNMIGIKRMKGRKRNVYYLIDSSFWKPLNKRVIENVKMVLKMNTKKYQKLHFNGNILDTKNYISKSNKEIEQNIPFKENKKKMEWLTIIRQQLEEKLKWK